MSHGSIPVRPAGFAKIFQYKAGAAEITHDFLQLMQVFDRPGLPVRRILDRRKWPTVIILDSHYELIARVPMRNLQADRLLVLADVEPTAPKHCATSP